MDDEKMATVPEAKFLEGETMRDVIKKMNDENKEINVNRKNYYK